MQSYQRISSEVALYQDHQETNETINLIEGKQSPPFLITSKTWHELGDKLLLLHQPLRTLLNENIDLSKYGKAIQAIQFIFVAEPKKEKSLHQDYIQFDPHTKQLNIQHHLDYNTISELPQAQLKVAIAQSYIDCISKIDTTVVNPIFTGGYSLVSLTSDLKLLFQKEGWLTMEIPKRRNA